MSDFHSDLEKKSAEIMDSLRVIAKRTDTAYVIVTATVLEDLLEQALLVRMRDLSNKVYARLFTGHGPLATFSAKIDLAFALQIIEQGTAIDLHAVRELRNEFAHAKSMAHFGKKELAPIMQKFRGWTSGVDERQLYGEKIAALSAILNQHVDTSIFTAAFGEKP
jgi:DNA-binding MltR family transcriptional regulator